MVRSIAWMAALASCGKGDGGSRTGTAPAVPDGPDPLVEREVLHVFDSVTESSDRRLVHSSGLIDGTGTIVVAPVEGLQMSYAPGTSPVPAHEDDGTNVFVGRDGRVVFGGTWISVEPLHDGRARFATSGEAHGPLRYGYLDEHGEVTIPAVYVAASDFANGTAAVTLEDHTPIWIDPSGKTVLVGTGYTVNRNFSDGLAVVGTPVGPGGKTLYGYVDASGKRVIEPRFFRAEDFHDGFAVAGWEDPTDHAHGGNFLIDHTGAFTTKAMWYVGPLHEGLAGACPDARAKCGYIDAKGTWVIEPQFDTVGDFHQERALVCKSGVGRLYNGQPGRNMMAVSVIDRANHRYGPWWTLNTQLDRCPTVPLDADGYIPEDKAFFRGGLVRIDTFSTPAHVSLYEDRYGREVFHWVSSPVAGRR